MDGVLSPAFLQAACAKQKQEIVSMRFTTDSADPVIEELSCEGKIVIESIKDGIATTAEYTDLNKVKTSIQADANSEIVIVGAVTEFILSDETWIDMSAIDITNCPGLKYLDISYCENITELDLSHSTSLEILSANSTAIESLDFTNCLYRDTISVSGCKNLLSLNCGKAVTDQHSLTSLMIAGCSALTDIKVRLMDYNVLEDVRDHMSNYSELHGTIHSLSSDLYFDDAVAARPENWTVIGTWN